MIYKQFKDIRLSALGMGGLRFPVVAGRDSEIDEPAVREMVAYAIQNGVNYFDTAWGYHEGNSEIAIGKALAEYPRESYYLADKFPGYDLANMPKARGIFEMQLEKCRVEYFDFYLFHNVCESNIDAYLDPRYGIFEFLMEEKRKGRIRHLGFSTHGRCEVVKRFLDAYGADMEFCQIQLNYVDYEFQRARDKIALLNDKNIPIWVMEPVRGGVLAQLDNKYVSQLKELRPDEETVAWAFRFLQTIPGVTMILSGMSDLCQVTDNVRIFSHEKPLNTKEWEALLQIAADMTEVFSSLPCTKCRYCVAHCPRELDIPALIGLYKEYCFTGGKMQGNVLATMPDEKLPKACIGCRSCEKVCPQSIKISECMKDFRQRLSE